MKIAIAHHQPPVLRHLVHRLRQQHTVVWTVRDGARAIAQCRLQPPDLLLLDLELPQALKVLQRLHRLPLAVAVLGISSALARQASLAYDLVQAGAVDVVSWPQGSRSGQGSTPEAEAIAAGIIVDKLNALAQGAIAPALPASSSSAPKSPEATCHNPPSRVVLPIPPLPTTPPSPSEPLTKTLPPLILIGASTGGPQAIAQFLQPLPADFPAALVIIQHVSARFANRLAQWFQPQTLLPVAPAESGQILQAGQVSIAAEDRHLILRANQTLAYRDASPELHYCPSVDLCFDSVARHWPTPGIAMVLTGMGQDGARGLKQLRDRGWYTLAQDPASATIDSMPQAAIDLGAVRQVLSPVQIAQFCIQYFS